MAETFTIVGSDGETEYPVELDGPDGHTCTCKGFEYTGKCKHIKEAMKRQDARMSAAGTCDGEHPMPRCEDPECWQIEEE